MLHFPIFKEEKNHTGKNAADAWEAATCSTGLNRTYAVLEGGKTENFRYSHLASNRFCYSRDGEAPFLCQQQLSVFLHIDGVQFANLVSEPYWSDIFCMVKNNSAYYNKGKCVVCLLVNN